MLVTSVRFIPLQFVFSIFLVERGQTEVNICISFCNLFMCRNKNSLEECIILPVCKSFLRPSFEYPLQSWAPVHIKNNAQLERVQRRAVTLIKVLDGFSYKD